VTEKRLSKHPEEFGKGAIEGVAGPEAANNAAAAGTLTPMLALGLPTNATAAVMLAAFVQFGIQPGPLLFQNEGPLVWALIASLFIGNTLLLLVNLPLAPVWAKLLRLPRPYLYAGILFFATLGAYAVNLQAFDLVILLVLGALGFLMRRYGLPVLPLILGLILGPRAEGQLRKTLQLSAGDVSGLWSEPIAVVVYIIVALVLAWPLLAKLWRRLRPRQAGLAMAGGPAVDGPAAGPAAAPSVEGPEAGSYLSPAVEAPAAVRPADAGRRRADATHANHGNHANHGEENP
jgi:putative tricarboxylic transport membrane protein